MNTDIVGILTVPVFSLFAGRPFGINLVVTATCCDSDYCNTAPTFSINSAKFSFFLSIGLCIVRIMKLL